MKRHFKPALERAGLPAHVRLYDLRHTHATALLLMGEPEKVVSERMGHSTTVLTMDTYCAVLPTMQKAAAAISVACQAPAFNRRFYRGLLL